MTLVFCVPACPICPEDVRLHRVRVTLEGKEADERSVVGAKSALRTLYEQILRSATKTCLVRRPVVAELQ